LSVEADHDRSMLVVVALDLARFVGAVGAAVSVLVAAVSSTTSCAAVLGSRSRPASIRD
jgi:hypothetical protein